MGMEVFLATVLFVLAMPSAMSAPSAAAAPTPSNIYDLIIIGSGMSGLGAAKRAKELGVNKILILEARDRIGGRTFTQPLSITLPPNSPTPAVIDLGAAWIHGSSGAARGLNPMAKLANDAGTGYFTTTENGLSFDPQGREDTAQWDSTLEDMLSRWETYLNNYSPTNTESLNTVTNKFINSRSFTALQKTALTQGLMTEVVMDYAADLSDMSARWSMEDLVWGSGPDALPARGYSALVDYLATNQTIWTNYAVDVIDYSNANLVNVSGRVMNTAAKFWLQAKGVIVTMPLGYLQNKLAASQPTLFKPALSSTQSGAIKALGMGLLNKVILVWNDASWWSGLLTEPWVTIRNTSTPGAFSEYYNLAATATKLPVLICFNGASFARSVEGLSDEAMTIVTRWASDPWTYGSYSYGKVGMTGTTRTQASAPLGTQKRVGFAGEHTHTQFPATAHGAYLSGVAEAGRIAPIVKQ
ncbi:hypothetical protein VOLCADRAFT_105855 [Volvox carteri f. nagariensis]|uniref:Amine oxidase domain-containing protein n=1 Tax=Volvox carteri f. nagariensis TaxID=3068 RepID=D8U3N5_VOLCA|nr:uncharacterized protein VOLCADRAFT_105855 [Volvox carteri f. nagariensis]EFJ45562.1 hypothetical protein VOLCADRAFT_105855 [Volvox carteri f. nagariensis]|eukprot:XP_002953252.1 hypothetical protein VOLCADRAFT_105855 [Volvox carteri f. nagariensis]